MYKYTVITQSKPKDPKALETILFTKKIREKRQVIKHKHKKFVTFGTRFPPLTFGEFWSNKLPLKTLDTIGNCQSLVLTVGVSA